MFIREVGLSFSFLASFFSGFLFDSFRHLRAQAFSNHLNTITGLEIIPNWLKFLRAPDYLLPVCPYSPLDVNPKHGFTHHPYFGRT